MKIYNLPDTFVENELPNLPAPCHAVLFALLWYSNKAYKPVWPTLPTIARRAGVKSVTSVRKYVSILEKRNLLTVQYCTSDARKSKYGKVFTVEQIVYTFTLQRFIDWDIELKRSKPEDFIPDETARSIAQQAAHEVLQNLPDALKPWLDILEYEHVQNGVLHFKSKEKLSRSYAVEQFRKHGLKIAVA